MGVADVTRSRVALMPILLGLMLAVCVGRVIVLQTAAEEDKRGKGPVDEEIEILQSRRGTLYSRNYVPLALTVDRKEATANPQVQANPRQVAEKLAPLLETSVDELTSQLMRRTGPNGGKNYYVRLCRRVPQDSISLLTSERDRLTPGQYQCEGFPGVFLGTWHERCYPFGAMASPLLGLVRKRPGGEAPESDLEQRSQPSELAISGLERQYQQRLAGKNTVRKFECDAAKHAIPNGKSQVVPGKLGQSLVLTLDEHIQQAAEAAMQDCLERYQAESVCAVVVHPPTGQILAMVSQPSFDPRLVRPEDMERLHNLPVEAVYEPGSTLKPIVAAGIVEHLRGWETQSIYCSGHFLVGNRQKKCWIVSETGGGHGTLDLRGGVRESCNAVMVALGTQLNAHVLYDNFKAFGLTERTGCDLPFEARGILPKPTVAEPGWRIQRHADVCYGQGIAVTPLQLTMAIAALGNGGRLMRPYLAADAVEESGARIPLNRPQVVRQAVSARTAKLVTDMMVDVVEAGTGHAARIEGVRVAGKTGTAQIPGPNGYEEGAYLLSFVGFAPADDPRACILVMVRKPHGAQWSSQVCAPAFKVIMKEALLHTEIRPIQAEDPSGAPRV